MKKYELAVPATLKAQELRELERRTDARPGDLFDKCSGQRKPNMEHSKILSQFWVTWFKMAQNCTAQKVNVQLIS